MSSGWTAHQARLFQIVVLRQPPFRKCNWKTSGRTPASPARAVRSARPSRNQENCHGRQEGQEDEGGDWSSSATGEAKSSGLIVRGSSIQGDEPENVESTTAGTVSCRVAIKGRWSWRDGLRDRRAAVRPHTNGRDTGSPSEPERQLRWRARRGEGGQLGRQAEVAEDLAHDLGIGDQRVHPPARAVGRAGEDVDLEHLAQELGPGMAGRVARGA